MVNGAPSGRSTRLSLRSAKNPIDRLSGDQKKERDPSVPATGFASTSDIDRIHTRWTRPSDAMNPKREPSGATATGTVSRLSQNALPTGGATENRIEAASTRVRPPV